MARVVSLHVYPIKACGGLSLEELALDARGPVGDRRFMLVDDQGLFISQRKESRLAVVRPRFVRDSISLSAPGMPDLIIPLRPQGEREWVTLWDDRCDARGDAEGSKWFSAFLGRACRLVAMDGRRQVSPKVADRVEVGFADAFPLLLTSVASLGIVNEKLATPVTMDRFRPNIVIDDCAPFFEDELDIFVVGSATLRAAKPCARCQVINVDQATGTRGAEPLRTLTSFRLRDKDVLFGQNLVHSGSGMIRVGDEIKSKLLEGGVCGLRHTR